MRRSTIAALLSALVIPGAGHLYLRQFRSGIALIALSLACLWIVLDRALQEASAVMEKIQANGGIVAPAQLPDLVAQVSNSSDSAFTTLATVVLVVCWVFGIVDAWRLGRRAD